MWSSSLKTAYILVRHLDSGHGVGELRVAGGTFHYISQDSHGRALLIECEKRFPARCAVFGDWIYEKNYAAVPPSRTGRDPANTGDIPFEAEDLLLALRLFRPGDVSFIAHSIVDDEGQMLSQMPHRILLRLRRLVRFILSSSRFQKSRNALRYSVSQRRVLHGFLWQSDSFSTAEERSSTRISVSWTESWTMR
jgi:hypothetical protein